MTLSLNQVFAALNESSNGVLFGKESCRKL